MDKETLTQEGIKARSRPAIITAIPNKSGDILWMQFRNIAVVGKALRDVRWVDSGTSAAAAIVLDGQGGLVLLLLFLLTLVELKRLPKDALVPYLGLFILCAQLCFARLIPCFACLFFGK